jgi:hypothetical protein
MIELVQEHWNRASVDHPTMNMYTEMRDTKSRSKLETVILWNTREENRKILLTIMG